MYASAVNGAFYRLKGCFFYLLTVFLEALMANILVSLFRCHFFRDQIRAGRLLATDVESVFNGG